MKRMISFLIACVMIVCCVGTALGETAGRDLWKSDSLLTLGTVNGYTYENEILGYGCTLEGWNFADEARIAELNNWGQEMLSDDLQKILENADTVMDMYAATDDELSNINIQFQNMDHIFGALITEELFVTLSLPQLAPMMEMAGYQNVVTEAITVQLDGVEHAGIALTATVYGLPIYQKEVCIKCGNYMALIAVTSLLVDTTDEILANFYAL